MGQFELTIGDEIFEVEAASEKDLPEIANKIASQRQAEVATQEQAAREAAPQPPGLPGFAKTEAMIEQRPDLLAGAMPVSTSQIGPSVGERLKLIRSMPFLDPRAAQALVSDPVDVGKLVGGAAQRVEAAIANPILRAQEGGISKEEAEDFQFTNTLNRETLTFTETGKVLGNDIVSGLHGERRGELGDVFRRAGVPEPIAAGLGLLLTLGLTNMASKGKAAEITSKAGDLTTKGVIKTAKETAKRRPRVFNDRWMVEQATNGKKLVKKLDDMMSNMFGGFYRKAGKIRIDPNQVDDIILRSGADDITIKNLDETMLRLTGSTKVDTVNKLKLAKDFLRNKTPSTYYDIAGTTGKGGIANPNIIRKSTAGQLSNLMDDAVAQVDPKLAAELKTMNKFAETKLYPSLKKMQQIFGKKQTLETGKLSQTFGGRTSFLRPGTAGSATAAERQTIRSLPGIAKEFKNYIKGDYADDILSFVRGTKQLTKDMAKFRGRQTTKATVAGLSGAGIILGGFNRLRSAVQGIGGNAELPGQPTRGF
tara:strand:+ start:2460 stop:4070 length:1611 start_codon:yes stop_codon:yes gene_type:complete